MGIFGRLRSLSFVDYATQSQSQYAANCPSKQNAINPNLGTQFWSIPLVPIVFFFLFYWVHTALSLTSPSSMVLLPWLFCVAVWVYAIDFYWDAIRWHAIGFPLKKKWIWGGVVWMVLPFFWGIGSLLFFGKTQSNPVLHSIEAMCRSVFFPLAAGLLYLVSKVFAKKWSAIFNPILISLGVLGAIFLHDWHEKDLVVFWPFLIQGFGLFLLNVLLLAWMEREKDAFIQSPNIWNDWPKITGMSLFFVGSILSLLPELAGGFFDNTSQFLFKNRNQMPVHPVESTLTYFQHNNQFHIGIWIVLVIYSAIIVFPKWFIPCRWYRILIDSSLLLWILAC